MGNTCKTCINNDDGLCDRKGILVEDEDSCEHHWSAGRMPTHIYNAFCVLNNTAGLLGLEITGIRDRKTGKEWKKF